MQSLTTIPRELRDQILGYVIQSHQNDPPKLDQTFEELTQHRKILLNPSLNSWCNTVLNISESVVANATTLLLVNRQLHAETLASINRLSARVCELDIIILDEILPLLTWLHVPILTTSLDNVNVNFRISGSFDTSKERVRKQKKNDDIPEKPYARYPDYKGFRIGCGAGPAMGWQIYSILERFIKVGPVGECSEKQCHRHMTVKTLNINVETPRDVDPTLFRSPRISGFSRDESDEGSVLDPSYLADFIANDINALLSGRDPDWFPYGKILYEHVDTVVISLDGKELQRFGVATRLMLVEGFDERYISNEVLAEYKKATWEKRRERGLKVPRQEC
jgi:hypothetical protein